MVRLRLARDKVLFFPVTPFDGAGRFDAEALAEHVSMRVAAAPGAVFAACGTGEFHALSSAEVAAVVTTAVAAARGSVPVYCGAGGPLGHAVECARAAAGAGADGLLVMPPYLVGGRQDGLVDYVEAVGAASDLDIIVYHRGSAQFTQAAVTRLLANPKVVGVKDGVGDVALMQQFVLAAAHAGRDDVAFFNGLPTAELSQVSYDAIGVPYYSSAVFAMAPEIAIGFLAALRTGDDDRRRLLLDEFYVPLVQLRDEAPGFAVALIKAGVRLGGLAAGAVRPPLNDPSPEQTERLAALLDRGRAVVRS
jgi:5-dehydro-4-deoxyglucarate dehydratase